MNNTVCSSTSDKNEIKALSVHENIFPVYATDCIKKNLSTYAATPPEAIMKNIFEQVNSSKFSNFPQPESPASLHHFL
jgi:hypothetical protein